eukprot:3041356-Pleurochrysis_carterae.AAC.1
MCLDKDLRFLFPLPVARMSRGAPDTGRDPALLRRIVRPFHEAEDSAASECSGIDVRKQPAAPLSSVNHSESSNSWLEEPSQLEKRVAGHVAERGAVDEEGSLRCLERGDVHREGSGGDGGENWEQVELQRRNGADGGFAVAAIAAVAAVVVPTVLACRIVGVAGGVGVGFSAACVAL